MSDNSAAPLQAPTADVDTYPGSAREAKRVKRAVEDAKRRGGGELSVGGRKLLTSGPKLAFEDHTVAQQHTSSHQQTVTLWSSPKLVVKDHSDAQQHNSSDQQTVTLWSPPKLAVKDHTYAQQHTGPDQQHTGSNHQADHTALQQRTSSDQQQHTGSDQQQHIGSDQQADHAAQQHTGSDQQTATDAQTGSKQQTGTQHKSFRVVVIGNTGAGKSATINSLIQDTVAPTSDSHSGTHFLYEYNNGLADQTHKYEAVIVFHSRSELEVMAARGCALLRAHYATVAAQEDEAYADDEFSPYSYMTSDPFSDSPIFSAAIAEQLLASLMATPDGSMTTLELRHWFEERGLVPMEDVQQQALARVAAQLDHIGEKISRDTRTETQVKANDARTLQKAVAEKVDRYGGGGTGLSAMASAVCKVTIACKEFGLKSPLPKTMVLVDTPFSRTLPELGLSEASLILLVVEKVDTHSLTRMAMALRRLRQLHKVVLVRTGLDRMAQNISYDHDLITAMNDTILEASDQASDDAAGYSRALQLRDVLRVNILAMEHRIMMNHVELRCQATIVIVKELSLPEQQQIGASRLGKRKLRSGQRHIPNLPVFIISNERLGDRSVFNDHVETGVPALRVYIARLVAESRVAIGVRVVE